MDSTYLLAYNEIDDVPGNILIKVAGHSSPQSSYVTNIMCSGSIFAEYLIMIGQKKSGKKRSGPTRNVEFSFEEYPLFVQRDLEIGVYVLHYRQDSAEFETAIFGYN